MRRRWRTALGAGLAAALVTLGVPTLSAGAAGSMMALVSDLAAGQQLTSDQDVVSPNGSFRLVMQGDGNVVLYGPLGAMWASGTRGSGANLLAMQTDGNLVAYAPGPRAVWFTGTRGSGANRLVVQDDGNAVLYRADNVPVWATNTRVPGDTLLSGQQLGVEGILLSRNGAYRLAMQGDGNIVVYGPYGAAWASWTFVPGTVLVLQSDANLVAYAPGPRAVWFTGTRGSGANRLIMQDDGNAVLYRADGAAVWSTGTRGGAALCPPAGYGVNTAAPGTGRTVALTFDDGPGASTQAILRVLQDAGVTATFFNNGYESSLEPATVQDEHRLGFLLGNHTWSHSQLTALSAAQQAAEMDRTTAEQISLTNTRPCFFRPPYGEYNATTLSLAQERSMKVYTWSVDTEDWKANGSSAQSWIDRIITLGTAGGSQTHPVVLMHNQPIAMPATVAALPSIIAYYRDRGYTFVDLAGGHR